ncbi:MAG: hypothetical protein NWE89_08645 [Candidatus Bathyarchaeota archaeon]|nr:hypothetical protein [Candidatus Bathyarchaeota archaeon]
MCRLKKLSVLLILILLIYTPSSSLNVTADSEGTKVGGRIRRDTIWTKENSPYILEDDITISSDARLTIKEGVVVEFSLWSLIIDGELRAQGSQEEEIIFRFTVMPLSSYEQGRIYFTSKSPPWKDNDYRGSILEYVEIYCYENTVNYGLIQGGTLKIDHVSIYNAEPRTHLYTITADGLISNSLFEGVTRAINMEEGEIINNVFLNGSSTVISINNGKVKDNIIDGGKRGINVKNALIRDNLINNMLDRGINIVNEFTPYNYEEITPIIHNNSIMNCEEHALYVAGYSGPTISQNLIIENSNGIYFKEDAFYNGTRPKVYNNIFYNNDNNVYFNREDPRIEIKIKNNWWMTNDTKLIEDKIYYENDDPRLTAALYQPILLELPLYHPKIWYEFTLFPPPQETPVNSVVPISGKLVPSLETFNIQVSYSGPEGQKIFKVLNADPYGYFTDDFIPSSVGIWNFTVTPDENVLFKSNEKNMQVNVTKQSSDIDPYISRETYYEGDEVLIKGIINPGVQDAYIAINILRPDGSEEHAQATTDNNGVYETKFTGDVPGDYTATISWPGTDEVEGSITEHAINIHPLGKLEIVIQDPTGSPVNDVLIKSIEHPMDQSSLSGTTDENGTLLFNGVVFGDYIFTAEKPDYEKTLFNSSISEAEVLTIEYVSPNNDTNVDTPSISDGEIEQVKDIPWIIGWVPSIVIVLFMTVLYLFVRRANNT